MSVKTVAAIRAREDARKPAPVEPKPKKTKAEPVIEPAVEPVVVVEEPVVEPE